MQTCLRLGLTVSDEILYYNTLFTDQLLKDYLLIFKGNFGNKTKGSESRQTYRSYDYIKQNYP